MSLYPNVNEYNDITILRSKIIDLQYFLYRPDYILVEFEGYIYDATNFNSEDSKELFKKLMNGLKNIYLNKGNYDRNINMAFL